MRISLASKELHQRCWDHLGIWQPPGDLSWTMWRLPWLLLSQGMSGGLGLGIQSCSDWWEVDDLTNSKLLSYHLSVGYSTCNIKKTIQGVRFSTCWLWGKTGFFTCPWHCWPCPSQWSPKCWQPSSTQLRRLRPFPWHWQLCLDAEAGHVLRDLWAVDILLKDDTLLSTLIYN